MDVIRNIRYQKRDRGYYNAKAFLSPGQTVLVFAIGLVMVVGLLAIVIHAMVGARA